MRPFVFYWLFGLFFSLHAKQLEIEVSAPSAILMNGRTGAILFEKEAFLPTFPASTTKVATALYVLAHECDLTRNVRVSAEALQMKSPKVKNPPAFWLEFDGTKMGVKKGEICSLEALLHGLMMVSGNDAANVLAEAMSDSVPCFVEELNRYLRSIGCLSTHFCNPHGLHHKDHQTTAYDLARITQKALEFETFRSIVSKISWNSPQTNKQAAVELKQFNKLLKPGPFFYSKAIGVKTGYTSQAQYALVAAAEDDERYLIAVLLGCKQSDYRYVDAKALFEAAFREQKSSYVFLEKEASYERVIEGAKSVLCAGLEEGLELSYFPSEAPEIKAFLHWDCLSLPIDKGEKVGEIRLVDALGQLWKSAPLVAQKDVQPTFLFRLKNYWGQLFDSDK